MSADPRDERIAELLCIISLAERSLTAGVSSYAVAESLNATLTPKPDTAPPAPPSFGSSAADEMEAFARWVRSGHYNADDARDEIARAAENRVRELRAHAKPAPPKEGERALRGEFPAGVAPEEKQG